MSEDRRCYPVLIRDGKVYTLDGALIGDERIAAAIIAGFESASFRGHEPIADVIERERIPTRRRRTG